MIDTHAHIYADAFDKDQEEMLKHASERGIQKILMPNIDLESIPGMMQLQESYPGFCYAMMGLHPCSVQEGYKEILQSIRAQLGNGEFVAVGEIGIDLYWDKSTKDIQIEAFKEQCNWAIDLNLPVVIHSRESFDLIIDIVERDFKGKLKGVFHCFTGDKVQAARIEALGMYMGIGGVLTFKNSNLKEVIPHISVDRLLLETDSPYLAPVPHRGKRNEPAYVELVLDTLSDILGMQVAELDAQLDANALSLFPI